LCSTCNFFCSNNRTPVLDLPGLPADDRILAGLGEDEVPEPAAAVHVVAVDVPRAQLGEVAEHGGEALLAAPQLKGVGFRHRRLNVGRGKVPDLEGVVHAARDDLVAGHVEVRAQHLVPLTGRNNIEVRF
jgi:hypothetical protein